MEIKLFNFWIILGTVLTVIGIYYYIFKIWLKNRIDFKDKGFFRNISNIIAYVPTNNSKELPHIIAGVFLTFGLSILIGLFTSLIINRIDSNELNFHGVFITTAGFVFGIIISTLSFWTLWQTKKIEHLQGYKITQFLSLIDNLNKELEIVINDYRDNKHSVKRHHRFFLITTNPFLGLLSFPDKKETESFIGKLNELKTIIQRNSKGTSGSFRFEIICASLSKMDDFHKFFFGNNQDKINEINTETEKLLSNFENFSILTRKSEIPQFPQFAIVGNTIFEFTLDARAPHTEVSETYVVTDRARCEMYEKTFELLKNSLPA